MLGSKEVTGGIICLHKRRGKTLQSDSCGAKEWGIDRGTDKDRAGVKSRAGERQWKKGAETGAVLCNALKGYELYIERCPKSCLGGKKKKGECCSCGFTCPFFLTGSVTPKSCPAHRHNHECVCSARCRKDLLWNFIAGGTLVKCWEKTNMIMLWQSGGGSSAGSHCSITAWATCLLRPPPFFALTPANVHSRWSAVVHHSHGDTSPPPRRWACT